MSHGWIVVVCLVFGVVVQTSAHPGPHHDIERVGKLIEAEPHRPELWIERAHHRRLAGEYDAALADLAEAKRLKRDDRAIMAHRGLTLSAMGRDLEAEAELTRFLEQGPGSVATFSERARLRHRAGREDEAIKDFTSAIALSPQVELYIQRGELQEALQRWDEAAAGYREALSKVGPVGALMQGLVRVEIARGNHDAALKLIESALNRASSKIPWRLQKADILESAGRTNDARAERETALDEANRALDKRATAINLVLRAKVHLALLRIDEARRDVEFALKKSPRYQAAIDMQQQLNEKQD